MITLAMDTSAKYLNLALYQDDQFLDGCSEPAFKKQSELIFVRLNELLEKVGLTYKDINEIVITKGPGSYTGLRIAMSIAKTLCTFLPIKLFVINTMQLYAGKKSGHVLLDARAKRAFYAKVKDGVIEKIDLLPLEEIEPLISESELVFGDAHLIGRESEPSNFLENFIGLKDQWTEVENVHTLKPEYLKEYLGYA